MMMAIKEEVTDDELRRAQEEAEGACPPCPLVENWRGYFDGERYVAKPEITCSICLDDTMDGRGFFRLLCSHEFHVKCLGPWMGKGRRSCPMCRQEVVPQQVEMFITQMDVTEDPFDDGLTQLERKGKRTVLMRCELCKSPHPSFRSLRRHKQVIHAGRFICSDEKCIRSFDRVGEFVDHLMEGDHVVLDSTRAFLAKTP